MLSKGYQVDAYIARWLYMRLPTTVTATATVVKTTATAVMTTSTVVTTTTTAVTTTATTVTATATAVTTTATTQVPYDVSLDALSPPPLSRLLPLPLPLPFPLPVPLPSTLSLLSLWHDPTVSDFRLNTRRELVSASCWIVLAATACSGWITLCFKRILTAKFFYTLTVCALGSFSLFYSFDDLLLLDLSRYIQQHLSEH